MPQLPRVDAVLVQAVIAGALSFAHLHDLAAAAGQEGWKAWAYPVSVDLLLVAAWHRLRHGTEGKAAAWCWFLIALAASLGANIATAGLLDLNHPPDWLRILVAGWPALAFFGGTLLAHQPTHTTENNPTPAETPDVELTVTPEPAAPPTEPARPAPIELPAEPAPEPESLAEPEPEPEPTVTPAPPVPAALVDHARKLSADHKRRTGYPIDADGLRTRLGVPAPTAAAIAAQIA